MPMTDDELMEFIGIKRCSPEARAKIMARITPAKRAHYESMADTVVELNLWAAGLGPKPQGVIVCGCSRCRPRGRK
jgi:hypothetical protein